MGSNNLTIIFLTANKVPKKWAKYQKLVLLKAADGLPIITISRKPLDWGHNLIDTEPESISNIYFQLLRGAKTAKTPYVGVAEDDTLYPKEHFHSFRPPQDSFSYNINRLGLFTWGKPTYFWKYRQSNAVLISPRKLLVDTLEERYQKYPNGTPDKITGELGRKELDDALGVSRRKCMTFQTVISVLRLDHEYGVDQLARSRNKTMGIVQSYDVPHWGKAKNIVKKFL